MITGSATGAALDSVMAAKRKVDVKRSRASMHLSRYADGRKRCSKFKCADVCAVPPFVFDIGVIKRARETGAALVSGKVAG
jgi:hypothetical protein